ncbi:crotonase/enoyl-CoA hydratase family protein [Phytohabitans kaempferiae]|uniref:Crotonase/enoyl-CoA hydratase family protein n=1 Tax=Phytohabitans kaempferiae TaxID=1620943 RepID=A0ABV6MHR8_9ACTN
MTDHVVFERDGHIDLWTLNQPATRNPVSDPATVDALVARAAEVNLDRSVRAVIITGRGKAFSSGGDVKAMKRHTESDPPAPHVVVDDYRNGIQRLTRAMYACDVPTIAAVNGPAVGAGCDLALMCDLRIASESAFFAESFVKVGLIPGDGGTWFLPRILGTARAAEMILTGDRVSAQLAASWGLVSQVVPDAELARAARELADRVAANPPIATRAAKRLLRESIRADLDAVLERSAIEQAICHQTEDHHEAVLAFIEGRTPAPFTGN